VEISDTAPVTDNSTRNKPFSRTELEKLLIFCLNKLLLPSAEKDNYSTVVSLHTEGF